MDKKAFKEKQKNLKIFQQETSSTNVPFPEIYEPHLPRKRTNILTSLVTAYVMMLVLVCALALCLAFRKSRKKRSRINKFIPIVARIVNSSPSFRNGKSYYFFI